MLHTWNWYNILSKLEKKNQQGNWWYESRIFNIQIVIQ